MSLEALLLLFTAYSTGTVLSKGVWNGSLAPLPGYLAVYLLGFVGFLLFVGLELQYPKMARLRFVILLVTLSSIILLVTGQQIQARQRRLNPINPNDGVVQSVTAAEGILSGQNPYTMDFGTTAFRVFPSPWNNVPADNVARYHYAYPPLQFLVFVPIVEISRLAHWTIDYQTAYLLVFGVIVWLLCGCTTSWRRRSLILLFTFREPVVMGERLARIQ